MRVKFPRRSKFLSACESAVKANHEELLSGKPVVVQLPLGGYGGSVSVVIRESDPESFEADWSGEASRFPQRIKVAAWTLQRQGWSGSFIISHGEGILTILRE